MTVVFPPWGTLFRFGSCMYIYFSYSYENFTVLFETKLFLEMIFFLQLLRFIILNQVMFQFLSNKINYTVAHLSGIVNVSKETELIWI